MTLKEHIDNVRNKLKNKEYPNEQAVRLGIIDPLLRILDWPTNEPQIVFPEYPVGSGNVDYALCHPSSTPRVFIEAKQVGNIKGAEEQLFGYDSRIRVPIAVLTDGQIWRFFHPTGEGTWAERKTSELDFIAGNSEKSAECLSRYLNYESIRSGKAVDAIREDYDNLVRQRKIEGGLPEAWRALIQESDKDLIKIVAEKTENVCGHRPDDEQVIAFLQREELPPAQPNLPKQLTDQPKQLDSPKSRKRQSSTRLRVTMPNGEVIERQHAKATFIEVLENLGIEKVMSVHPSTVLNDPPKYFWCEYGQFYIHYYPDTDAKKRALEEIAQLLGVQLIVEIVPKR